MQHTNTTTHRRTISLAIAALLAATSAQASTTFLTNNTANKTLASNESDAVALDGASTGTITNLTLSQDDSFGTIVLTTVNVSLGESLFMDGDSMGHGNDKWGTNQNWTFTFDQTISFDGLTFKTINEPIVLMSTAWVGNEDASGSNWSFNGETGQFRMSGGAGARDFTTAGVSLVPAGTEISFGFGFFTNGSGGEELTNFTISVVPEPSTLTLLGGVASLLLLRRRRS